MSDNGKAEFYLSEDKTFNPSGDKFLDEDFFTAKSGETQIAYAKSVKAPDKPGKHYVYCVVTIIGNKTYQSDKYATLEVVKPADLAVTNISIHGNSGDGITYAPAQRVQGSYTASTDCRQQCEYCAD